MAAEQSSGNRQNRKGTSTQDPLQMKLVCWKASHLQSPASVWSTFLTPVPSTSCASTSCLACALPSCGQQVSSAVMTPQDLTHHVIPTLYSLSINTILLQWSDQERQIPPVPFLRFLQAFILLVVRCPLSQCSEWATGWRILTSFFSSYSNLFQAAGAYFNKVNFNRAWSHNTWICDLKRAHKQPK